MTTPLIAILFITQSSAGPSIPFRWPPHPTSSARLARPLPYRLGGTRRGVDGIWQASHLPQSVEEEQALEDAVEQSARDLEVEDDDYRWEELFRVRKTSSVKNRSRSVSRPSSRENAANDDDDDAEERRHDYEDIFDYSSAELADILSPGRALCHQKFELIVDDLAFVGHPVRRAKDDTAVFDGTATPRTHERYVHDDSSPERGRSLPRSATRTPNNVHWEPSEPLTSLSSSNSKSPTPPPPPPTYDLEFFHLVLVIDRPDPASYHLPDLSKLLNPYHSQIAFKLTAALFQEELKSSFVAKQCTWLAGKAEQAFARGGTYEEFASEAAGRGGLAGAMRDVYEALSNGRVTTVHINDIPVDVQLPPPVTEEWTAAAEQESWNPGQLEDDFEEDVMEEDVGLGFGWTARVKPWNALVMLEEPCTPPVGNLPLRDGAADGSDGKMSASTSNGDGPFDPEQGADNDSISHRLLTTFSPTLSVSTVADLLDLDLWRDVIPEAKKLIYKRKAKAINVVRENLKNIYYPVAGTTHSFPDLADEFSRHFPRLPPLPTILASLSASPEPFASIVPPSVQDKSPYLNALIWMLKKDLLEMMHVRIRVLATEDVKQRVLEERERKAEERGGRLDELELPAPAVMNGNGNGNGLLRAQTTRRPRSIDMSSSPLIRGTPSEDEEEDEDEDDSSDSTDRWSEEDMDTTASIIPDPGRATKLEGRWLDDMCVGKKDRIVDSFKRLLPYFDGKTTTDEILYRTAVRRRELREVLHDFEPYIITVLHP